MISYNRKELLISLHIPKCGGTSFDKVLQNWFGFGFHKHYMNHLKMIPPKKGSLNVALKNYIPACIHGHFDKETDTVGVFEYYPSAKQFITLYRDPLNIQLSYYFYTKELFSKGPLYWKGEKMNPETYLGNDIDEHLEQNREYRWLSRFIPFKLDETNYKDIIEKHFIHVGITEDLQNSINIFADKLYKKPIKVPIENNTKRSEIPSESSIKKFKEKHKFEYQFYDYICSLNK